jgi:hypothetical protein
VTALGEGAPVTADEWDLSADPPTGSIGDNDPVRDNSPVGDNDPVDDGADEAPALYYLTVEAFVREHLALTYRRQLEGRHRTWCPQWWRHPEAIIRLEALWRSWEHLRLDPALGMSVWLRDHADHHMGVLLDADGPFKGCGPDKGHSARVEPLPHEDAPAGLFDA